MFYNINANLFTSFAVPFIYIEYSLVELILQNIYNEKVAHIADI